MLSLSAQVLEASGRANYLRRLDAGLQRHDAVWAGQPADERLAFLKVAWQQAEALGLHSERGVAAYALAGRWLGLGFEQDVPLLLALLQAPMPEIRRVHGLCEWVHDQLGPEATPASGEAVIRRSFALTEAWGREHGPR